MSYLKNKPGLLADRVVQTYRQTVSEALVIHGHNRTRAAKHVGVSRRTLMNYIIRFNLTRATVVELAGCILPQPADR
jgi:transcriptional regulator with PAS, ATPase and Fis domain